MKQEFSKKLVTEIKIIFILVIVVGLIYSWLGKDTSIFAYLIPSMAGIFGAGVVFYLNKSKMENIFKGRTELLKQKFDLIKQYPERKEEIENEIQQIDSSLEMKINQETSDVIQENITIQNY